MSNSILFVCNNCGEEYAKWQGKCENCGEWNTLKEFTVSKEKRKSGNFNIANTQIVDLNNVKLTEFKRVSTKITEFDRVLGAHSTNSTSSPQASSGQGGIVPGSVILLGGNPGIGKSTLLLQVASNINNVLYVSGEESIEQIKLRFDRLGLKSLSLKILAETDLEAILGKIIDLKPTLVIIDSIQTMYSGDFPSTPGSIVQVRECAMRLQKLAKTSGISIILVGHVTKEGSVAGPRILEHLVDVVLYLEGEDYQNTRILRGAKNRFGATDEIGIFEMEEKGLVSISNPSKLFLSERAKNIPGSVVTATIEGTRALLIEVQALTTTSYYGFPQRRATGFDLNRLQLIIAVLQKRANLNLSNQDVFVNIAGGIKINDTGVDLAVALAIASSLKNLKTDTKVCAFGEIGLSGEIRLVSFAKKRSAEAERLGFEKNIKAKFIDKAIDEVLLNE